MNNSVFSNVDLEAEMTVLDEQTRKRGAKFNQHLEQGSLISLSSVWMNSSYHVNNVSLADAKYEKFYLPVNSETKSRRVQEKLDRELRRAEAISFDAASGSSVFKSKRYEISQLAVRSPRSRLEMYILHLFDVFRPI